MLLVGGERSSRANIAATAGAAGGKAALDVGAAADAVQGRCRHPPGLARHGVAAGHRQGRKMAEAAEDRAVDRQQLAAPGGAVVAEADAVEREAEQRTVDAMLGRDRGDVRVVMLDRVRWQ